MSNPVSKPVVSNGSNAKYISLIAENGTEFSQRQKVVFNIDPSVGFIKARDSYLVIDLENTSPTFQKVSLANAGASSLIKQVNIYSQHNGMLLESLNDYNKWVACEAQYRYDETSQLSAIEGFPKHLQSKAGLSASDNLPLAMPNHRNSTRDIEAQRLSPHNDTCQPCFQPVRYCVPLRCGIFRHWDDEALVPVLLMGGLRVELILAETHEVFDLPFIGDTAGRDGALCHLNSLIHHEIPIKGGANAVNIPDGASTIDLFDIRLKKDDVGLCVGNAIQLQGSGTTGNVNMNHKAVITAIDQTGHNNHTKITFAPVVGGGGGGGMINGTSVNPTTNRAGTGAHALDPATQTKGGARLSLDPAHLTESSLSYKVRNIELRLLQEQPPAPMSSMNYVFTSYDTFNDTVPRTQTNMNQDITSVASKAVSLFTMYENQSRNRIADIGFNEYYTGRAPFNAGWDLNSVVYFINNKLYPLRPYNPSPKEDKVINQNELVKAWGTLNIPVKKLGCGEYCDLDIYTNRYMHARELARQPSVFNLQNAEPQIRLGFASARGLDEQGVQIVNTRMTSFVFSKKVLSIDGESGLTLEH